MNKSPIKGGDPRSPVQCLLCRAASVEPYCVARDLNWGLPHEFGYLQCKACKFVFQWPQPEASTTNTMYPEFYGTNLSGANAGIESHVESSANRKRADVLARFCSGGSIFDVGCGDGVFLEYMRRRGWAVGGVESAPEHVAFAREQFKMSDVSQGSWPGSGIGGQKWDVCSFIHVIEHLPRPIEMLERARDVLRPDGLLMLETPNVLSWPARLFGSNWVALDAPRHLHIFSPDSLGVCVERAGFRILCLLTYSPSTMEYSESFRYLMQARGWRLPDKAGRADNLKGNSTPANKSSFRLLDVLHHVETSVYRGVNRLADAIGSGCNILLIAEMSDDIGCKSE